MPIVDIVNETTVVGSTTADWLQRIHTPGCDCKKSHPDAVIEVATRLTMIPGPGNPDGKLHFITPIVISGRN